MAYNFYQPLLKLVWCFRCVSVRGAKSGSTVFMVVKQWTSCIPLTYWSVVSYKIAIWILNKVPRPRLKSDGSQKEFLKGSKTHMNGSKYFFHGWIVCENHQPRLHLCSKTCPDLGETEAKVRCRLIPNENTLKVKCSFTECDPGKNIDRLILILLREVKKRNSMKALRFIWWILKIF